MLGYSRPHGSNTEKAFTRRFIDTLPGIKKDLFGNAWIDIPGNPEAAARILQDYGLDDSFLDSVYWKGR